MSVPADQMINLNPVEQEGGQMISERPARDGQGGALFGTENYGTVRNNGISPIMHYRQSRRSSGGLLGGGLDWERSPLEAYTLFTPEKPLSEMSTRELDQLFDDVVDSYVEQGLLPSGFNATRQLGQKLVANSVSLTDARNLSDEQVRAFGALAGQFGHNQLVETYGQTDVYRDDMRGRQMYEYMQQFGEPFPHSETINEISSKDSAGQSAVQRYANNAVRYVYHDLQGNPRPSGGGGLSIESGVDLEDLFSSQNLRQFIQDGGQAVATLAAVASGAWWAAGGMPDNFGGWGSEETNQDYPNIIGDNDSQYNPDAGFNDGSDQLPYNPGDFNGQGPNIDIPGNYNDGLITGMPTGSFDNMSPDELNSINTLAALGYTNQIYDWMNSGDDLDVNDLYDLVQNNPLTGGGASGGSGSGGTDWTDIAAILGGSLASGYFSDQAADRIIDLQRDQFEQTREDFAPYREAGYQALSDYQNALGDYNTDLPEFNVSPDAQLPGYSSTGQQLGYQNNAPLPEYDSQGQFEFNLEADPGYRFAVQEGTQAAERAAAARGMNNSGNILAEISDRVTGIASQYAPQAFQRQLATSQENYGRGVTDYGIERDRADTQYNRGVTDYGILSGINTENYNRNVQDFGLNTGLAQMAYGRDRDRYNVDVGRENELYNRNQNRLSQLGGLINTGSGATANVANAGQNATNAIGGAISDRYTGLNNAVQGGLSNYLFYDNLRR